MAYRGGGDDDLPDDYEDLARPDDHEDLARPDGSGGVDAHEVPPAATGSSKGGKGKRGIVQMIKLKKDMRKGKVVEVDWNIYGQPIGPHATTFSHFIGTTARKIVPIVCVDFRRKNMERYKEEIWEEVKNTFSGLTDERREWVLSKASELHRIWRSMLRTKSQDKDGNYSNQPPEKYAKLRMVTEYWSQFINHAQQEEFQRRSKQNKAHAQAMEARYRGSKKSYARHREDIIEEKKQAREENPNVSEFELWVRGRTNADGNVDDPKAFKIVETVARISQEDPTCDDLLARVIPKQYPGRVRGIGFGVTKKSLARVTAQESANEVKALKSKIDTVLLEINNMKAMMTQFIASRGSVRQDNFATGSGTYVADQGGQTAFSSDPVELPECPTKCFLFLDHPRRCVAIGTVYPQSTHIHNVPLQTGCVRVNLEIIKDEHAYCELPYPTAEARFVCEGVRQFFQWPRHLVVLDTPEVPKKVVKGKEKVDDGVRKNRAMERAPKSPDVVSKRRLGYPTTGDSAHDKVANWSKKKKRS